MASPPRRIVVISAEIGAGHDGAADELSRRLMDAGYEVDRHDFLNLLPPRLGRVLRNAYAFELHAAPWAWGRMLSALERHGRLGRAVGGMFARLAARRTTAVTGPGTAAVVSTYPLASQALGRLRRTGRLTAPVATFLTDMSVHPLWVADGVDLHLALHPVASSEAGHRGAAEVVVSGPLVAPAFRPSSSEEERRSERARLGLPIGPQLALVVAGSWGVGEVEKTAREIAVTRLAIPVIACGSNSALRDHLLENGVGVPLGWVNDMPALLRSADVVIQNAGGLTSLEAMASGVPVVSYRCLPGHGVSNAAALDEAGLAVWIRDQTALAPTLRAVLEAPGRWATGPLKAFSAWPTPDHAIARLVNPCPVPGHPGPGRPAQLVPFAPEPPALSLNAAS
jgi:UDP-N-acetylglucosamine:LPS N-acetylglucosamine transferase